MKKAFLILGELNNDDLDWMIKEGKKRSLHPDETLIYEGQQINAFYIVLSGTLSVLIESLDNKELARLSTGEVVGEISFIDTRLPVATVKALEESVLLEIPRLRLTYKLERDMGFAARFYRGISRCLSDRVRGTVLRLGYGLDIEDPATEEMEAYPDAHRDFALVQAKFKWLMQGVR
ncbi:MAG: cyclic nucleotide-binding domain-containing protein [Cyanobacteriota bacterium]|nr:cyclic nucleotide-binding domain-containing protein [Cyanobacteriota bacterium]